MADVEILGGKYELVRLIGVGGMGEVYEALNRNTGRRVAIKTLHGQAVGRAEEVARFIREARVATRVEHPNVVQVLDLDVDPSSETPYIVQELLTGESLEARLKKAPERRLSPAEALRVAEPVVSALVAAHELGVVHRDLKPANIFLAVGAAGELVPKVIDFGIAKLLTPEPGDAARTQTGALIGSPAYMSPEQACGAPDIDALTDVWSMGVVLYQMLSGRLPYEGGNAHMCIGLLQTQEPTPLRERAPELPEGLLALVDSALVKDRASRTASMAAMLAALRACEGAASSPSARGPTRSALASVPSTSSTGWTRDRDRGASGGFWLRVAGLCALLTFTLTLTAFLLRRPPRPDRAAGVTPTFIPTYGHAATVTPPPTPRTEPETPVGEVDGGALILAAPAPPVVGGRSHHHGAHSRGAHSRGDAALRAGGQLGDEFDTQYP